MASFTFLNRVVHSFEDATMNFEQIEPAMGHLPAYGTQTLTWPGGSPYSNTLTFDTGLGTKVLAAAFGPRALGLGSFDVFIVSLIPADGTLSVQGVTTGTTGNPAANATANFLWIAIG